MMEYEIIATVGPATWSEETLHAMVGAGVTAFRLNTSTSLRKRWSAGLPISPGSPMPPNPSP